MPEREERAENPIPRTNISIPLLILCALCVSSILFNGRILKPRIESTITPTPAAQLIDSRAPTTTSMPVFTSTFLPPPSTPSPLPRLYVITLTGTTDEKYEITVRNNTLLDATNWTSTAIGPGLDGTTSRAVEVSGTNNSAGGGTNITWRGGMIIGSIPESWSWRKTHDFGGGGIFIQNDGPIAWQYVRIHNVEDGIKPREAPEYSNTGSWIIHDCYFTAIRDDAIDNDRFEPGTVQDCLFDGVYVFISEQDENVDSNSTIGPDENNTIYINRVYVRLYGTNGSEGAGKWFKWQGDVPHHTLAVSDSIFAIGSKPRLGWADETIPREVKWVGHNNFLLWLGNPGEYGGPKPEGVTFLEGAAARDKWISMRNKWLTDHGLPPQNFPADYNPHDAPITQIPVPAGPQFMPAINKSSSTDSVNDAIPGHLNSIKSQTKEEYLHKMIQATKKGAKCQVN